MTQPILLISRLKKLSEERFLQQFWAAVLVRGNSLTLDNIFEDTKFEDTDSIGWRSSSQIESVFAFGVRSILISIQSHAIYEAAMKHRPLS